MTKKKVVKTAVLETDAPEIVQVELRKLVPHKANMRHVYELAPMAELVLKMLHSGYDPASPAMVREVDDGKYQLIRGHRRRIALYFASTLIALGEKPASEMDLHYVLEMLEATAKNSGSVQAIPGDTEAADIADVMIYVIINDGDYKSSFGSMWGDNFGNDEPDLLGMAYSFRDGIDEGYSPKEIAGIIGKSVSYVNRLISLGQVDGAIAELIERGDLAVSVASFLMGLPVAKREGAVSFILRSNPSSMTAQALADAMALLKKWNGFTVPLTDSPLQRNIGRAISHLWRGRLTASPSSAWAAAFSYFYRNNEAYVPPYGSPVQLHKWLVAFGLADSDMNITKARGMAIGIIGRYLSPEDVACESCPVMALSKKSLGVDVDLPCRSGKDVKNCMRGMTEDDPFYVGVPSDWAGLEGVQDTGTGRFYAPSFDALLEAWTAREDLEAEREVAAAAATAAIEKKRKETNGSSPAPADSDVQTTAKASKTTSAEDKSPVQAAPVAESPLIVAQAKIAAFAMLHPLMDGANHFMATPCGGCKHKLEGSPTADNTVAPCAWAAHPLQVKFEKLVAADGSSFQDIPICRQYQPKEAMAEIIPEYPLGDAKISRQMMIDRVAIIIAAGNGMHFPFEWLSGVQIQKRPVVNWMSALFAEKSGDLSDGQIMTMFQLAVNEDGRCNRYGGNGSFWIPESDKLIENWVRVEIEPWDFEL